ncbi:hypothetical protein [Hallerella porci]|uniref:Uncharacterized protein n=1 Tax=Hallerella porci TaxID=1945871 RepID=A0ABX5LJG8_9BACT|nr:hypothetical protein [Hallerella porci]PWK95569.1 hypothetical protein B0H50_11819 [Hallerella porci]
MKRIALCIFVFSLSLFAADKEDLSHNACAAAKKCLNFILPRCSEAEFEPVPDVEYNAEFCSAFLDLQKRGIDLKSPVTKEIFGHLGGRYRVTYETDGELPVNGPMMSYLFDHFPFTTALVNAIQETNYTIHYNSPDQRIFSGDNGGNLFGDFYWTLQDSAGTGLGFHNVFYGSGRCKILRWNLHGIAIAILDMYPSGNKTRYRFKAIVFPANAVLNSIMKMGFFRDVVKSKISEIIKNISESSESYVNGNHEPVKKSETIKKYYTKNLEEFQQVDAGKIPWTVGDAVKKKREESQRQKPQFVTETQMIFKQNFPAK